MDDMEALNCLLIKRFHIIHEFIQSLAGFFSTKMKPKLSWRYNLCDKDVQTVSFLQIRRIRDLQKYNFYSVLKNSINLSLTYLFPDTRHSIPKMVYKIK